VRIIGTDRELDAIRRFLDTVNADKNDVVAKNCEHIHRAPSG
jgi:hypothetical protein